LFTPEFAFMITETAVDAVLAESPPTTPTPPPTWGSRFNLLVDELEGGTIRRLAALADAIPTEGPPFWQAFREFLTRLCVPTAATTPAQVVMAAKTYAAARWTRPGGSGGAAADLAAAFVNRANALLDVGDNDPADPIIRPTDFPRTGSIGEGPLQGHVVGWVAGLPLAHPAHSVPAVGMGSDAHVIVGPKGATWARLSEVAKLTAAHRARQPQHAGAADAEAARRERIKQLEAALARERAAVGGQ
jgi:hypothetical protein